MGKEATALRCADCDVLLPRDEGYQPGDICRSCFDAFDGMTVEAIIGAPPTEGGGEHG